MSSTRVPLFPLGVVLLPRMPLPLHIFEERYRLLVGRCLENDEQFGIVLNTGSTIQGTGCMAKIEHVINEYEDGRYDILVVGTDRFELLNMYEERSYLEAEVRFVRDVSDADTRQTSQLAQEAKKSLQQFAETVGYDVDQSLLSKLSNEELSFMLATTDVFSMEERQKLLESRSTAERLRTTTQSLANSTKKRQMTKAIKKIVGDDTDVSHLFN